MIDDQYEKDTSSNKIDKKQEVEDKEKLMQENMYKEESQSYASDNNEYDDNNYDEYYKNYSSDKGSIKSAYNE